MTLRPVNPPGPAIPGISQGMIVENANLMFLSGHTPIKDDGTFAGPGLESQLGQVFANLEQTLKQAGIGFANVIRLTIYVRDYKAEHLPVIRETRDRFVDAARPPASALVGVAALFHPDVLVEIDAIAAIPKQTL
jgi:enamine deaminase RidA (YjgF/YER057c/UK114 family)